MKKPLLLAPAGSYEALVAAIDAGADEVYFGAKNFNARQGAVNFDEQQLHSALDLCRVFGVKSNITLNTLCTDRELPEALNLVYDAASYGADCFIVQDLGLASLIKKTFPQVVLHASTQCACHSLEGAKKLAELGFSRIVLARELPWEDIKKISSHGFETEIFVHGALCVCHSGMCLMSSVIGSRSGNRGMCAQPCRLPYSLDDSKKQEYPMSLKDLTLSKNIEQLLKLGVSSLKIEGRRKSPEYVGGVVKLWRQLLDDGISANQEQYERLSALFSRDGFTNSYFTSEYRKNNFSMYGVRREEDKSRTIEISNQKEIQNAAKVPVDISCEIKGGQKARLSARLRGVCAEYVSDFECPKALSSPLTEKNVFDALSKLGNTHFELKKADINISGEVFLSKSMLNSLRRGIIDELTAELTKKVDVIRENNIPTAAKSKRKAVSKTKIHLWCKNPQSILSQKDFNSAEFVSLPLEFFENPDKYVLQRIEELGAKISVRLPRVMYNNEYSTAGVLLDKAKQSGAVYALVSNVGHIELAKEKGYRLFFDFGANVFNSQTVDVLQNEGAEIVTLSSELNSAQMRDIAASDSVRCAAFVKGTLPLMVLESCIVRANKACRANNLEGCAVLTDRKGYKFTVCGEKRLQEREGNLTCYPCRNIIYNSVEADILSKEQEITKRNTEILTVII